MEETYILGMPKKGKVPKNRKPSTCPTLRGRGQWRLQRTHPLQEMAQDTPSGDVLLQPAQGEAILSQAPKLMFFMDSGVLCENRPLP